MGGGRWNKTKTNTDMCFFSHYFIFYFSKNTQYGRVQKKIAAIKKSYQLLSTCFFHPSEVLARRCWCVHGIVMMIGLAVLWEKWFIKLFYYKYQETWSILEAVVVSDQPMVAGVRPRRVCWRVSFHSERCSVTCGYVVFSCQCERVDHAAR